MPSQTLTVAADNADGYESGGSWNVSGAGGFDYVQDAGVGYNAAAFSFVLTDQIPAGALVNSAYFRARTSTDVVGTITVNVQVENSDPATNTIPSGSHLPSTMTPVAAHSAGSITYVINTFYFGSADTNPVNIGSSIQTLVDSFGVLNIGDRINIFVEGTAGAGYTSFVDFTVGTNRAQLTIDWLPPGDVLSDVGSTFPHEVEDDGNS